MWIRAWSLILGLSAAVPASAQASALSTPPTSTPATTPDRSKSAKPKVVCKRVPVIGSNVGSERVCVVVREGLEKSSGEPRKQPQDLQDGNGS
jgi:hypothetical protein